MDLDEYNGPAPENRVPPGKGWIYNDSETKGIGDVLHIFIFMENDKTFPL